MDVQLRHGLSAQEEDDALSGAQGGRVQHGGLRLAQDVRIGQIQAQRQGYEHHGQDQDDRRHGQDQQLPFGHGSVWRSLVNGGRLTKLLPSAINELAQRSPFGNGLRSTLTRLA